tara:strand:- start:22 stop:363 length:342 start_codon:yes stop_codon:yes gene_type:complete
MTPIKPKGKNKTWIAKTKQDSKSFKDRGNDNPFYNTTKWRTLRKYYITKQPLCEVCQRFGKIIEGKVVDHIKRVKTNPELALIESNLQTLCNRCHNIKSGSEGHRKKNTIIIT